MPVLGHAFVGWVTALEVPPRVVPGAPEGRARALWIPVLVALAYGPDVAGQLGVAFGWSRAPTATHSLAFAILAAPVAGLILGSVLGVRRAHAAALALGSMALHDVLDLLQTPERQPFWPLSPWHLVEGSAVIPASGAGEALLFSGAFVLYLAAAQLARSRDRRRGRSHHLATTALVTIMIAAAGTTHYLRGVRERQLQRARILVGKGLFDDALAVAEDADRWPSTAHPGRVEHVRAEALEELGDLDGAIAGYSRAVEADPDNFWAVADLAAACARSPRKDRSETAYVLRARLLRDFPSHPALRSALARIDQRLTRHAR